MNSLIRKTVSKKKRRYQKNGFDLDLSYITDKIIAMGFPSENMEGVYRNPFKEVFRFLEQMHKDHYKVYNLCSERSYDISKFHNRVECFPFDDHNSPPLDLIFKFCENVKEWLDADDKNVVVIHCKAGKGRTGLMICSYMLYSKEWRTAHEALHFYAAMRTYNQKGVTIPSQLRYVNYFADLISNNFNEEPPQASYLIKSVELHTIPKVANPAEIRFSVYELKNLVYSFKESPKLPIKKTTDNVIVFEPSNPIPVKGDIKLDFYEKGSDRLFAFWMNTLFVQNNVVEIPKAELDKANKDRSHKAFEEGFKVVIHFLPADSSATTNGITGKAKQEQLFQLEDDPSRTTDNALQDGILNKKAKCTFTKRHACEVGQDLLKQAIQLFVTHNNGTSSKTETVYETLFDTIRKSKEFSDFETATAELRKVSLDNLLQEENLSFWINVFHTMCLHGYILYCHRSTQEKALSWTKLPTSIKEVFEFHRKVKYQIGASDLVYSVQDIEFGILRSTMDLPESIVQLVGSSNLHFAEDDPRLPFALSNWEPRINFALNYGTAHSPRIRVYQPLTIYDELERAVRLYLRDYVDVDPIEKKIVLPQVLEWFSSDFARNHRKMIKSLLEYVPKDLKKNFSSKFTTTFRTHDFKFLCSFQHLIK